MGIFSLVQRVIPPVTSQLTTVFLMNSVSLQIEAVNLLEKMVRVNLSRAPTILDKVFGTKWSNPVKVDRKRNVW